MSEPQARSTLGTRWRTAGAALPIVAALLAGLSLFPAPTHAQIRGRAPVARSTSRWWFSAGAGAATMTDISDGPSRSKWQFGPDPMWQMRGSIERSSDDFTTLGIAAAYGRVDVTVSPLSGAPATPGNTPLPAICATTCQAEAQLFSLMGQFRSGGGTGFHTLFEATGGVTGVRDMRTRDSLAIAIGKRTGTLDLSGTLGAGFGYPVTQGMVLAVVQDFGIGWHTKTDLPSGTGRTWRVRTTRASVRFSF
jgi:hypothetical protein